MKIPISWLKDFIEITIPLEELAHMLTMAGLEVEAIQYVGLPMPEGRSGDGTEHRLAGAHVSRPQAKISGLAWEPDKIVTAEVYEVMPHPNADRLVLCRLYDGEREQIVLTGAPNLYPYKGLGRLPKPLKVPYAREGARIYDGHQPGQVLTTLKRAKIRGVESYSMICSEKELGVSDEHEGVIILDEDAPVGIPLVDYMGDAVFDIAITPNIARDANVLGVAREIAALTDQPLRPPSFDFRAEAAPIAGQVNIQIENPEFNPRFVLGLISNVEIRPSPYWVQRRLRLAGMRPINNIVDATNYAMWEVGEPLHAFDYDALVRRASGEPPTIITRTAHPGERLITLDGVERRLDDFTVLVCDAAGALSIAGVMGGAETEVSDATRNVLLEGAAWNFINVRRTLSAQHMSSEAAYRFSRGVHPAMAKRGVGRGLELMRQWSGGSVSAGLVDAYPLPPVDPIVEVTPADVERWLGIQLSPGEIADLLRRLEFTTEVDGQVVRAGTPDHRLDIGLGVIGLADVLEEIARIYGYERIPETRLADPLPPQRSNPLLEREELVRDVLVDLGLQEVVTYRMTSAGREARRVPDDLIGTKPYFRLTNPITPERNVLRQSLLASVLEVIERNARLRANTFASRLAFFEIGPVFFHSEAGADHDLSSPQPDDLPLLPLPDELPRLAIALTGLRQPVTWEVADMGLMNFYDLKGVLSELFDGLRIQNVRYTPAENPTYHPGMCARMWIGEQPLGVMGVLHPRVQKRYDFPPSPVLGAEIDLAALLNAIPERYPVQPIPEYPPILEDVAVIVDESIPAERVEAVLRNAAGEMLASLQLFDIYRGEQIGVGKKSLAYKLTYQVSDRTLKDKDAQKIRQRIVQALERELRAHLRS